MAKVTIQPDKPRKESLDSHSVIRHAYENAITAAARLHLFATGNVPTSRGPIAERQEVLAADDLIAFAIHSRRLVENTLTQKTIADIMVQSSMGGVTSDIPITRVMNILIHHRAISVVRSEHHLEIALHTATFVTLGGPDKSIEPTFVVVSDNGGRLTFRIREMVETYQANIISPIVDLCAEHMLFLDLDTGC